MTGVTFGINPGSYYATCNVTNAYDGKNFMLYTSGYQVWDPDRDPPEDESFYYEFANPVGMAYREFGVPKPSMSATVRDDCDKWTICVKDTGNIRNGIRYIEMFDYQNTSIYPPPALAKSVGFESGLDPLGKGEVILDGTQQELCFSVVKKADDAHGVLAIYDNSGYALVVDTKQSVTLAAQSHGALKQQQSSTLYQFETTPIDSMQCGSLVIRTTDTSTASDILITGIVIPSDTARFHISTVLPKLPLLLHSNDSLIIGVCYHSTDTASHQSAIIIRTTCPIDYTYTLIGKGSTALIDATDIQYHSTKPNLEECKMLTIRNVGKASFKLTGYTLNDSVNFKLDPIFISSLPILLLPSTSITASVCFRPKEAGKHIATIGWLTDINEAYNQKLKSYSLLSGESTEVVSVEYQNTESVFHASIINGSLQVILPKHQSSIKLTLYDLLGREVGHWSIDANVSRTTLSLPSLSIGTYLLTASYDTVSESILIRK